MKRCWALSGSVSGDCGADLPLLVLPSGEGAPNRDEVGLSRQGQRT